MLLRLFVDFYNGQHLAEHGGVSRQFTYQKFQRDRAGEQGPYVIWGFGLDSVVVNWNGFTRCHQREVTTEEQRQGHNEGIDFFRHLESLDALHLADWVPHLVESDAPEAMAIHPYGLGQSESIEDRLGQAAHLAGMAMLTPEQRHRASVQRLHRCRCPGISDRCNW